MSGHILVRDPAAFKPFRYMEPKGKQSGDEHVYIVGFDSGLIKVGYTVHPQERVTDHISAASVHGASPVAVWISKPHVNARPNESKLIAFCRENATQRFASEYFTGLDFAVVVDHALALSFHLSEREAESALAATIAAIPKEDLLSVRKRLERRRPVEMSIRDYERFIAIVKTARTTNRLLKELLGLSKIPNRLLPEALRRASDDLENARPLLRFYLRRDWDQLLTRALGEAGEDDAEDEAALVAEVNALNGIFDTIVHRTDQRAEATPDFPATQ